ncbi:mevalonate kinase [Sphaceloma murrayae]|uniref:Mevalonate kinase n=1 Tax=Sphaceloma murrayae TaxID=2082308 RepID=A0A2K1QRX8_9PEZI|nr:mevalonate kinase [Sphaceloma murrayae]
MTQRTTATVHNDASPVESFMVSAPGKVIVFGEHAVVYGKAAMAASISLRSYLHVQPGPLSPEPSITLDFVDIGLSHTWTTTSLPWSTFTSTASDLTTKPPPTTLDPALVSSLEPHITPISPSLDPHTRKIHSSAASTFLYLFLLLSRPTSPSLTFTLRSTIPIGAGLGSSASISVCLATALLHLNRTLSLPPSPSATAHATLTTINALSFLGESLIHGTPSGVDNTVSTLGKAVVFQRLAPGQPPRIDTIRSFPELPLLVVDTKQPKSTSLEVSKVRLLRERHPVVVEGILDAIHGVTEEARALITTVDAGKGASEVDGGSAEELVLRLGELVTLNHGLLSALGTSHPRLEELRGSVERSGAGWFKLTGAGGGGCGFVLLRGETTDGEGRERLRVLEDELGQRGFEKYETSLGGDGVGISLMEDGEITLGQFLAAKGTEGVQKLCGGERNRWRYWRFA